MFKKVFGTRVKKYTDTFTKEKVEVLFNTGIRWMYIIIFSLVFSGLLKIGDQAVIALCTIAGLVIAEIITVAYKYMAKAESESDKEARIKLEREKLGLDRNIEKTIDIVEKMGDVTEKNQRRCSKSGK